MCGRYDLSESPAAIGTHFNVPSVPQFAPSGDVRPTQLAPIIRVDCQSTRESALARWGLVPFWAKDLKFGARCINARIETLAGLPVYREAFGSRRCLVPASAFFEWSGPAGHRIKWRITPQDRPVFGLAGLWERWFDPNTGEPVQTYTIVTTAANERLAPLHDRMPVIVRPERYESWLDPRCTQMDLFVPVDAGALRIETV